MQTGTSIELSRDCNAVQIPHGSAAVLPKGAEVVVTQTLGGSYTVHSQGALYRISGTDADALGLDPGKPTAAPAATPGTGTELDEKHVWDALKTCFDPEIPVNIVDL